MKSPEKHYLQVLRSACEEIRLDYFPQVEASELLYKIITLGDIYLPLSLAKFDLDYLQDRHLFQSGFEASQVDIEALIRKIDDKIAELKREEAEGKAGERFPSQGDAIQSVSASPPAKELTELNIAESQKQLLGIHPEEMCEASEPAIEPSIEMGMRLLLRANPGAGKTTFCKRLVLAYLDHDLPFLNKYFVESGLYFNHNQFPILLSCKNITELSTAEIQKSSFPSLVRTLCSFDMGNQLLDIPEDSFLKLLDKKAESGVLLILDGWDEILDLDKENAFKEKLNDFLTAYPHSDLMVTIRIGYYEPALRHPFSSKYYIKELTDRDIKEFCKKWCEIILSNTSTKKRGYEQIADQIINSSDPQIDSMRKNPLDLSLLLTVSKNDGRLPENKADLFKEVVELYIYWSIHKNTGSLSSKSIRIFLAYIATHLTKQKKMSCSHDELTHIINQCIKDLEWSFSEDVSGIPTHLIIKELCHTGILMRIGDGKFYTFSESRTQSHRQMQEYLTAYAIQMQYADEEYNNMSPLEIFEDKYSVQLWSEVILFVALMSNGRLRHELVKRLITKAQNAQDENYDYTDLLFSMVVNGADIRLAEKHTIYDVLFEDHITDRQISQIVSLVMSDNRVSVEFINYINERFSRGVAEGNNKYSYAKAIIESSRALQRGLSPFDIAEQLLITANDDRDIVTATNIVIMMAWFKYADILNSFKPYCSSYKLSDDSIVAITELLRKDICKTQLLKCIKEAILAGYVSFSDFFSTDNLDDCYEELETYDNPENAEIIVSMAPVFAPVFLPHHTSSHETKDKYLKRFKEENEKKEYDKLIFTFAICVAIGCWRNEELDDIWTSLDKLYSSADVRGDMGKVRFRGLKLQKNRDRILQLLEAQNFSREQPEYPLRNVHESNANPWFLISRNSNQFIYERKGKRMIVYSNEELLSYEALEFLNSTIVESATSNNDLAYLLRRNEIVCVETIEQGKKNTLTPEALLKTGVLLNQPFSLINMALLVSKTHRNTMGVPETGRKYLSAHLANNPQDNRDGAWDRAISWWLNLACERQELEGLVVINWLFGLKIFLPAQCDSDELRTLMSLAAKIPQSEIKEVQAFVSSLKQEIELRKQ